MVCNLDLSPLGVAARFVQNQRTSARAKWICLQTAKSQSTHAASDSEHFRLFHWKTSYHPATTGLRICLQLPDNDRGAGLARPRVADRAWRGIRDRPRLGMLRQFRRAWPRVRFGGRCNNAIGLSRWRGARLWRAKVFKPLREYLAILTPTGDGSVASLILFILALPHS